MGRTLKGRKDDRQASVGYGRREIDLNDSNPSTREHRGPKDVATTDGVSETTQRRTIRGICDGIIGSYRLQE